MEMCDSLMWELMGLQSGQQCGASKLSMYKIVQAIWGSALELILKCRSSDKANQHNGHEKEPVQRRAIR